MLGTKDIKEKLGPQTKLYVALLGDQLKTVRVPQNPNISVMLVGNMKQMAGFERDHRFLVTTAPNQALPLFDSRAKEAPSGYAFVKFTGEDTLQKFLDSLKNGHNTEMLPAVPRAIPGEEFEADDEDVEEESPPTVRAEEKVDFVLLMPETFEEIRARMHRPRFVSGTKFDRNGRRLPSMAQIVYETLDKRASKSMFDFQDHKHFLYEGLREVGYTNEQINLTSVCTNFYNYKSAFRSAAELMLRERNMTVEEELEAVRQQLADQKFRHQVKLLIKHRQAFPEAAELLQLADGD